MIQVGASHTPRLVVLLEEKAAFAEAGVASRASCIAHDGEDDDLAGLVRLAIEIRLARFGVRLRCMLIRV